MILKINNITEMSFNKKFFLLFGSHPWGRRISGTALPAMYPNMFYCLDQTMSF